MVFSSLTFLYIFLPVTLVIYYIVPKQLRNLFILISGLFFYAWGEPIYVFVLIASTMIDYFAGLVIYKAGDRQALRKLALIVSMVMNLSLLGFFKYSNFIIENINNLFGTHYGSPTSLLPIGISFFTFQSMSYTIDLYRKNISVQKNPITFAAFVTLFPQIVAGPIVRYEDVAAELDERVIDIDLIWDGVLRFAVGLGKKVLIANNIGVVWTNVKAMNLSELPVATAWLGIAAYTLQIYFDFSGYSDMAIGLGKMLGFHFPENFNYPYMSKSISEFWRRWHMTLSGWFKSYVYFPLGGSLRTCPYDIQHRSCLVLNRCLARCKLELHSVGFSVRCSDHYRKTGYNRTDKSRKAGYLYKDSFYHKTCLCDRSRHAWMGTL